MAPSGLESREDGVVVAHLAKTAGETCVHERDTLLKFAERIAALRGERMGGVYSSSGDYGARLYYVPDRTLTSSEAAALGIGSAGDLFGGVVPQRFVGSKAISHPLVTANSAVIDGWTCLAPRLKDAVLEGYSAFSHEDAREGGLRMLVGGPVRVKAVQCAGGHGQTVVHTAGELAAVLDSMPRADVASHGVVLERNLDNAVTFSVGQVVVADLTASYYGTQRSTRNNRGEEVFGGSDLTVVRGGFDALLAQPLADDVRRAVVQATRYDDAVHACYPGFYASRKNYDVVRGIDARGRTSSGVLEQSWRVGGATGPELAALEAFRAEPRRTIARASCYEVFGDSPEPPAGATVYWRGEDPALGMLTKYTIVHPDRP